MSSKYFAVPAFLVAIILSFSSFESLNAQSVSVGNGSYSTTLPPGAIGPEYANGGAISPKVTADFSQSVQTNDFWSSLIFPFFGDPHSSVLYAHPLNMKAANNGLEVGYTEDIAFPASDYLYPYYRQLTVGVEGLNTSQTLTKGYGDWTFTASWESGDQSMEATSGHGLPFIYFKVSGGDALITTSANPNIWHRENGVIGMTVDGRHYGVFAPDGSSWEGTNTLTSALNGDNYFSIALLPDNDEATLEQFRKRAYAFVTNSFVDWQYDETTSALTTSYRYETELMEEGNGNLNETMTALYRHQWLNAEQELTTKTYESPRGTMKLYEGSEFSTKLMFSGILPALPDEGNYDRDELLSLVRETANESLGTGDTYNNGKAMGRFAELVHIADQLGAIEERDHFLAELKNRLEDWFTVGGAQEYSYNEEWDVLTGYPSGFGADREINDHHFHASYAIRSASVIAQYDPEWAAQENWGGMVNLLIRDASNWTRDDELFPFLRNFDSYAGHSWAAGHGAFGDGNNQESSSESMNYASSVFLWGSVTGQTEIRDLGIFLHSTERTAIEQYWMDVDDVVFPESYPHKALGIVWGSKGAHTTWFGGDPEFIHGINFLPINSGSLYLGRHPDYVLENYAEIVAERGSQPVVWKDVMWQYLSMSDPETALDYYLADPNYQPFDGESRAHTMHWLYNMQSLGQRDTLTYADISTYSVFRDENEIKTYVAYNPGSTDLDVQFSDGFSMTVPAGEMKSALSDSTSVTNEGFVEKPSQTSLQENYPNPFNPTTNLTFTLSQPANVTLEVFNAAGQKIATLVNNQTRVAGSHTEVFDATNLASGLYIYRLRTNTGFTQTRKMMLIK